MPFKITGYKILLKPEKPTEFYGNSNLIVRPEDSRGESRIGYSLIGSIEQIGSEVQEAIDKGDLPRDFPTVGDTVICAKRVGADIKIDGVEHKILSPEYVLCKVEE